MPHTNENPSQQNKEILESFAKEFGHNLFCKDFPENEPKTCRCDYTEFKDFLLSTLEQKEKALEDYKKELREKVERLKLECDTVGGRNLWKL